MNAIEREFTLRRKGDQIVICFADGHDEMAVRLVWARPVTGRGQEVSIVDAKTKKEVLFLRSLEGLDAESRAIAEASLDERYFLPVIERVMGAEAHFGNRYWHVQTDRGAQKFLMKSPETNTIWIDDDRCVVRDVMGNCYEIRSFAKLDPASRAEAEKVL